MHASDWRLQIEQSQAELHRDVGYLRTLLTTKAIQPRAIESEMLLAMNGAVESASTTELIARLAALADQVSQLNATMLRTGTARPADASHVRQHAISDAIATSDLAPLQRALQVLERQQALHCENIANANTLGYKLRQLQCTSELHESSGLRLPKASKEVVLMTTGVLEITQRSLDVAIDGDGFFAVRSNDGVTRYSRGGSLQLDADGRLVTAAGAALVPEVIVPADTLEISIDPKGNVTGRTASDPDHCTGLGWLELVCFTNPDCLLPVHDGLFAASPEAGAVVRGKPGIGGLGTLMQGFVERSNVQVGNELIELQLVRRQLTTVRRVLAASGIYTR
jgi:flagellar basal-body rod protein FlgG